MQQNSPATAPDAERLRQVGLVVRQLGAQSVLSSAEVAKQFGIHSTDLEVLDLIFIRGTASAGELATATGLTSGSVTALIDRLLRKGYVTRREDPDDRRRTIVQIDQEAAAPIENFFLARQRAMFELWSQYDSRQLDLVCEFVSRSTALLVKHTAEFADREVSQPVV